MPSLTFLLCGAESFFRILVFLKLSVVVRAVLFEQLTGFS